MQAGLLFWHASQQNASVLSSDLTFARPNVTVFTPKNIQFANKTGLRFGLMVAPSQTLVDIRGRWTYYHTSSTQSAAPGLEVITSEFFSGFLSQDLFFAGKQHWKLTLHQIEVDLGRNITINDAFTVRPAVGVSGASIKQRINATWNALLYVATERVNHDFTAIGPSLSVSGTWRLLDQVNVVGNLAANFYWGKWNVVDWYQRPRALFGFISPTTITTNFRDNQLGTMMLNYFLGVEWQTGGQLPMTIQLGYEMQYWANQLRTPTFQQLPLHGDLTLQGGTCAVLFD